MTSNLVRTLTRSLLLAAGLTCSLSADTITYTLTNLTASGGDPTYSVATDVTFNSLSLRENFADATSSVVSLYDFTNTTRTSLTTSTFDLNTLSLNTVDPAHGALVSATVTGVFSTASFSIVTSFGGTPTVVTVSPSFSATLPLASSSINVNAIAGTASYAVGTLQSAVVSSPAVPEPSTYAIGALGLLTLFALGRHRFVR